MVDNKIRVDMESAFGEGIGSSEHQLFSTTQEKLHPVPAEVNSSVMDMVYGSNESIPVDMTFTTDNLMNVIVYSILFVIGAMGNITVFMTLFRHRRHRRSRLHRFIMHLNIADLIVTFIVVPLEIGWKITVSWDAGDAMCRCMMFFRGFGFYLSSFVLIMISLDRYFAITYPLSLNDADHRSKIMLILAWLFSFLSSIPQSIIFHIERNPDHPDFIQCVTFNFFPTRAHEIAYNMFSLMAIYILPLLVIIICYTLILFEISKKTKESKAGTMVPTHNDTFVSSRCRILRRSAVGTIEKARARTLKMTIVIVLVFIVCWTPYFVMSAWFWFDSVSALKVPSKVSSGLFLFAVSNSCMNPIVYGMFTTVFRRAVKRRWVCFRNFCIPCSDSGQEHETNATLRTANRINRPKSAGHNRENLDVIENVHHNGHAHLTPRQVHGHCRNHTRSRSSSSSQSRSSPRSPGGTDDQRGGRYGYTDHVTCLHDDSLKHKSNVGKVAVFI